MFKGDFNEGADISDPAQGSAEPADEPTRLLGNIGITASSTPEEITSAIQSYLHSGIPANAAEPKPAYSDQYDTPGKRYDDTADFNLVNDTAIKENKRIKDK